MATLGISNDGMKNVSYYKRLWIKAWVPVLACILAFSFWKEIKVSKILDFQFSSDFEEFNDLAITHCFRTLKNTHYFDFIFIIVYTYLFFLTLKIVFKKSNFEVRKEWLFLAIIPGIFDCIENVIFLLLLNGRENLFDGYFWAVRLKWAFLIPFFLLLLATAIHYGIIFFRKQLK